MYTKSFAGVCTLVFCTEGMDVSAIVLRNFLKKDIGLSPMIDWLYHGLGLKSTKKSVTPHKNLIRPKPTAPLSNQLCAMASGIGRGDKSHLTVRLIGSDGIRHLFGSLAPLIVPYTIGQI
jgi:hypothetical protein